MSSVLPLTVLLPLLGAGVSLLAGSYRNAQRTIGLVTSIISAGLSVWILLYVDSHGAITHAMGGWEPNIAINLVADRFGALMLLIGGAMLTVVMGYALGQTTADASSPWYIPTYLVLNAGVSLAFISGDLFNLFVAIEILLMASYVLITLEGNNLQIRSGTTYVVLNVVASTMLLMTVSLVFAATGTLNLALLPERLADLSGEIKLGLNLLLLMTFGLKAAVFPLYSWLPDSYPAAPGPVSAVFAGLLTKIGVYALIRTETLLFPGGERTLILVIAGLTIVVGALGAIAQSDIKRILSFNVMASVGFLIMGIGLGGAAGIAATIFYMIHHIPAKTALFLVEGIIERDAGSSSQENVAGMARRSGPLAVLFLLPALSLAGLPPLSGFLGKLGIVSVGLSQHSCWIVGFALLGSLLTLASMTRIWTGVFWGEVSSNARTRVGVLRHYKTMSAMTLILVVTSVCIALFGGPIYSFAERAAADATSNSAYQKAVLGP